MLLNKIIKKKLYDSLGFLVINFVNLDYRGLYFSRTNTNIIFVTTSFN